MELKAHEKLQEAESYIEKQNKHIDKLEKGIKNALTYMSEKSGTYDHPRRLSLEETTKLYSDLVNLMSHK